MVAMREKLAHKQHLEQAAQAAAAQAPLKNAWNEQRLRIRDECEVDDVNARQASKQYRTHGIIKAAWQQLGMRGSTRVGGLDGTIFK